MDWRWKLIGNDVLIGYGRHDGGDRSGVVDRCG